MSLQSIGYSDLIISNFPLVYNCLISTIVRSKIKILILTMSRTARVLLRELLEYVQKKGGPIFATEIRILFSKMSSATSDKQILEIRDQYIAFIKEQKSVQLKFKDHKIYLTVSDKVFRIYCDRNKEQKLFLVIDYWRKNKHNYCYQLLSNNITIASFG